MSIEQLPKRGPGRPPKAPWPPKAPPEQPALHPATDRIAALNALRAQGVVIVPVPPDFAGYLARYPMANDVEKRVIDQAVYAWLVEVSQAGAGQDVDAAWVHLDSLRGKSVKEKLYNEYVNLRRAADRKYHDLAMAAEDEQRVARLEWQRKQDVLKLKRDIAALEAQIAAKRQKLAQLTA